MATLSELAVLVGGVTQGDGSMTITGVAPTHTARCGEITFLEKLDRFSMLRKSGASAAVVPMSFSDETLGTLNIALIKVENVIAAFEKIALHFMPLREQPIAVLSERAFISPSAKIGDNVRIEAFAVIGDDCEIGERCVIHSGAAIMAGTKIGKNTVVFPNVVVYDNTIIGERCIIHANTSIGAYGFGYDSSTGIHRLSSQLGNVVIGNDVEIGACSTIDRATYGSTIIEDGTKIDNLVMIAHNCRLGKHNMICAHVGIAGSTTTGDYVVMAGRVGVRDHVHIGSHAVLGAMAGIIADVPENAKLVGIPATPRKEQMEMQLALAKLPAMRKEFKALQKAVAKIETEK